MDEISGRNDPALFPPNRGLSLGWRLALSTALIISLVMGGISVTQQLFEIRQDREIRRELLKLSLTPLAVRLESAASKEAIQRDVEEFHRAYVSKGYPAHDVLLLDAVGRPALFTSDAMVSGESTDHVRAEVPIASSLFEGGQGTLVVLKHIPEYRDALRQTWVLWSVHFAITVGAALLFLAVATCFQVTRPVNRLVRGVKKMEMGYWAPVDVGGGAWEIRWLAWRFGNMVQEVRGSMTHLFEAERKASHLTQQCADLSRRLTPSPAVRPNNSGAFDSPLHQELLAVCERLESASPEDTQAMQLARGVWNREVLDAHRSGFHHLKARMEDAALRLMDPDTFTGLDKRLAELKGSWNGWAEQHRGALCRMLEEKGIPCAGVLHRVKHTAGVWAKMRGKGLDLDEVYDLFAFRILVPTEADCYAALGIIHRAYRPEVSRFKDYIAKPKANGYRSLHTCVKAGDGPVFEVQIRSVAMDRQAERGDAAHWLYKKKGCEARSEPVGVDRWGKIWRWPGYAARRSLCPTIKRVQQWRIKP